MASFDTLGLSADLLRVVEAQGFSAPTAIQAKSIPMLLEGRDLKGVAQTGGGKTAAFVLPLLHKLAEEKQATKPGMANALILAPTRELANQIGECIRQFSKGQRLFHTVLFGGSPFFPQMKALQRGVHIVVATPGRMMDHIRRGNLKLDDVQTFILDEADRMLDMGFIDEVKQVAASLPKEHQTVMFSATMNSGIRALADKLLNDPVQVEASKESTVAVTIDHRVLCVDYRNKKDLLLHLLKNDELKRVLIFTRTKAMADKLSEELRDCGRRVDAIHGDREQRIRQKVLQKFRKGFIDVLVATDVAARGIDVPDITHVINYDMPLEAESYVHRIGRTGRAGVKGTALSLCETKEGNLLRNVERAIRQPVPVEKDHPFHAELAGSRNAGPKRNGKKFGKPFAGKGRKPFQKDGFKTANADGAPRKGGKKPFAKTAGKYRGDGAQKQEHANDGQNFRKFKEGGYKGSKRRRAA